MFVEILIFTTCISEAFGTSQSSEVTLLSVGIFSLCENEGTRMEFNLNAERYKEAIGNLPNVVSQYVEDTHKREPYFNIEFISFDVCKSTERLVTVLTNILLNETFFRRSKHTNLLKQNIFLLHAYVSKEMSKMIQEMTSLSKFVKLCAPVSCDENYIIQSSETSSKYLIDFLETLQWRNVTFLLVEQPDQTFPYRNYFENSYNLIKSTKKFCLQKKIINISRKAKMWQISRLVFPILNQIISNQSTLILFSSEPVTDTLEVRLKRYPQKLRIILHDYLPTGLQATGVDNWATIYNYERKYIDSGQKHGSNTMFKQQEAVQYG
eukprot:TCONS_00054447-protein